MIVIISFTTLFLASVQERPYSEGFFTCMRFFFSFLFYLRFMILRKRRRRRKNSIKDKNNYNWQLKTFVKRSFCNLLSEWAFLISNSIKVSLTLFATIKNIIEKWTFIANYRIDGGQLNLYICSQIIPASP